MCSSMSPRTGYRIASFRTKPLLPRRPFHDYFVTHLPSSSLHPDSRSSIGPLHHLPRSASKPHTSNSSSSQRGGPSPAPLLGVTRDTTVVRIPLRSAKHHFGVAVSRGTRPYNEDTYQAGVIELPAFAKRAPLNLTRAPASSPLKAYEHGQQEQQGQGNGEITAAESASGDPQVFYFGVFDGHGGSECSSFLRERLHEYIEDAARQYGLESSLNGRTNAFDVAFTGASIDQPKPPPGDGFSPHLTSTQVASTLQSTLLKSWRNTVGGYFRRFNPPAFTNPASPPSSPTILTHAFLAADLHFITTQLRLSLLATDHVLADAPLNATEVHQPPQKPFVGGSTASIALISTPTPTPFWHPSAPSTLLTAHCGDTRILLCRASDGLAVPLTTDHHPSAPVETARLRRWGASFVTDSFGEERLGGLANTRSFGDMGSKRVGVSAEPEVRRIELAPGEYSFLVLVSDGVSGCVSDQEIADVVKEAKTPAGAAGDVVAYAEEVGEGGDNATCLVIRLGGWERRSEGGGGGWRTRERREWRKREAADPRGRRT